MGSIPLISAADADGAYAAAQCVVETHRRLAAWLREGHTLAHVDNEVARILSDLGARSCFRGYAPAPHPPFPSHACLSVNECVVHGTAGYRLEPLKAGDILKIDIGVYFRGWVGDAAWTYAIKEYPSDAGRRLMASGKESLRRGIRELRPGNTYIAWARAVQNKVEVEDGFHLVRGLGGHGYGRKLHAAPFVSNVVPTHHAEWSEAHVPCTPGTLLAVEPMVAIGTPETVQHRINRRQVDWPVFTADGSLSVHYEHDVLITESGPRVLTDGLDELPDIVG